MKRRTSLALLATSVAVAIVASACSSSNTKSGSGGSSPAGSANSSSSGKKLVIGDILFDTDAYQIAQQKQMQKYADSLGIKIIFENQQGKGTNAPNLMQDLLTQKVDGIIMQPADATVAVPLVKQAQAQHIPVLGWAIPFGSGVTAPYVGLDESAETQAAGKAAAQYVQTNFPGQPVKVLIVTITGVSVCSDVRMGPFQQGVKSVAPDAQITTVNGNADRNTAVSVTEDALQRDKGYNIVTGCNSDMAMGALQAFKSAGLGTATNKKPDHAYFYSINGTDEELQALTDPTSPLMADLGLTPKEVAVTLIDTLRKMISGAIPPDGNYTANVPDKPLTPDCASSNEFNRDEYFATTDLSCVSK
jgi:ABC-type sugar transport system substrate-binding protein